MFHDMRESLCIRKVSMLGDVREGLCITWLCAFLEGMGSHLRMERLKAERVRQSLLVTMAVCWNAGSLRLGFRYGVGSDEWPCLYR